MAEILKGKPVADAMKEELTKKVEALKARDIMPKLGIIRVGARPDDLFYEGGAKKTCDVVGMTYEVFEYPEDINQADFEKAVTEVGANASVHGILMFAPLPKHLDDRKIRALIPVEKDVDCLTLGGAAKVFADDLTGFTEYQVFAFHIALNKTVYSCFSLEPDFSADLHVFRQDGGNSSLRGPGGLLLQVIFFVEKRHG